MDVYRTRASGRQGYGGAIGDDDEWENDIYIRQTSIVGVPVFFFLFFIDFCSFFSVVRAFLGLT